jgi:hypothetical protein
VTDELTEAFTGDGFTFRHPAASAIEVDVDPRVVASAVLTDAERPLLIAVAVEDSLLDTARLQVPGLLGALVDRYRDGGDVEELWYGRLPVEGTDAAEAAEIRYGAGDPRQAVLLAARIDGPRILTVQVHFPPSVAESLRPLALAILESVEITA